MDCLSAGILMMTGNVCFGKLALLVYVKSVKQREIMQCQRTKWRSCVKQMESIEEKEFNEYLSKFYKELLENQVDLETEINKLVSDNFCDLIQGKYE